MKRYSKQAIVLTLLVGLGLFGWSKANAIADWFKLRNYEPPANIVALADNDTMNAYTRRLFYINHPKLITSASDFRSQAYCPENLDTIVLGCYHPGLNGIFIYNVQDSQLQGITQVTAAHEVLHAVYERLSSKDRETLNAELQGYYKNGLTDQRVIAEVKIYQQTEPTAVYDEMSCTFGTEIASLPQGLENYYKRFFTNRQAIIAYEQKYEANFTSRTAKIDADNQKLSSLKIQIDTLEASLKNQVAQIDSDRSRLDNLRSSGQIDAYNSQVPAFNAEVDAYNAGVAKLQANIAYYNSIIDSDNDVIAQLKLLNKAIDTRQTPQPTQ